LLAKAFIHELMKDYQRKILTVQSIWPILNSNYRSKNPVTFATVANWKTST